MEKKKTGFKFWLLVWGLGLAGQLCWNMENQWFNTFVYEKIAKDPTIISWMVAISATATAVSTFISGTMVDRKGRTFLLRIGTAGLSAALVAIGILFLALERGWLQPSVAAGSITLAAFLALVFFYSFGPGVCVWLVLSELMPTRIRANGMSIALFSNQFVAWGLASMFLPLANAFGFGPLFLCFALFGMIYFVTVLFIPETKGKTLEEIETLFDRREHNA